MTDAETPPETTPPENTLSSDPAPRGVPLWVPVALALALIATLVASLVAVGLLWRANEDHKTDAQRDGALVAAATGAQAAATTAATDMTTYSWKTVDTDFQWVDTAGTDNFKTYFSGISEPAIKLVKQLKANAVGTVIDSGVQVEDATHVKVVLFVDQRISGAAVGTSEPDQSRVVMYMVDQNGVWLVDRLELKSYANNVKQ